MLVRVDVFSGTNHVQWWASREKLPSLEGRSAEELASLVGEAVRNALAQDTLF